MKHKHAPPARREEDKRQPHLAENKHTEGKDHTDGSPLPLIDQVKPDPAGAPRNDKNDNSDSSETKRFQKRYLWTQWLLVAITLVYCASSIAQWSESRAAVGAMTTANRHAEQESLNSFMREGISNLRVFISDNASKESDRKRLEESNRLNKLTANMVAQAKKQADIAAKALDASNDRARHQAAEAAQAIDESNRRAEESRKVALAAIEESRAQAMAARAAQERSFIHGARARLWIEGIESQGSSNIWDLWSIDKWEGTLAPIGIKVKNLGNSNTIATVRWEIATTADIPTPEELEATGKARAKGDRDVFHPKCDDLSTGFVASKPINKGEVAEFRLPFGKIHQEQVEQFKKGDLRVTLVGCIHSVDEIGEVHRTRICAFLYPLGIAISFIDYNAPQSHWRKQARVLRKLDWTPCADNNLEDGPQP